MHDWSTEAWFAAVIASSAQLDPTPGATIRSQYVITGAPSGDVRYIETIEDGRLVALAHGVDAEVDVTVTVPYEDFKKLFRELITSDQLTTRKVEGKVEKIASLLPVRQTEKFKQHTARVRDFTRWPD